MTKPNPPESIPKYVREGVERQDSETLTELASWAESLAAWKDREIDPEEIESEIEGDEQLEEISQSDRGTVVEKKVPCGKSCGGCPHGPYRYVVHREGDSLVWEYKGKVQE